MEIGEKWGGNRGEMGLKYGRNEVEIGEKLDGNRGEMGRK